MTSSQIIRWGIAGPGAIADKVAADFGHVDNAELVAIGSRSEQRATEFAARHGADRGYGSYAQLLADPEIDAVYIATPHPQHQQLAVAALTAGKAVLVEKAFTATVAGTEAIITTAQSTGQFAMEAMWTRFQPAIVHLRELVADGAIGEIRSVQADLGVRRPYDPASRMYDPAQGGGAMLDLGVYVVSFAQMLLGTPESVHIAGSLAPSGVDAEAGLLLGFDGGRTATLTISLNCALPGNARVFGTAGWIDVLPRFHHPNTIVLHRDGDDPVTINRPASGGGYSHELSEVTECLRAGVAQSAVMPLADTLTVQRILNEACEAFGVHHYEDESVL
jgi:predicted dehydrogenase